METGHAERLKVHEAYPSTLCVPVLPANHPLLIVVTRILSGTHTYRIGFMRRFQGSGATTPFSLPGADFGLALRQVLVLRNG